VDHSLLIIHNLKQQVLKATATLLKTLAQLCTTSHCHK